MTEHHDTVSGQSHEVDLGRILRTVARHKRIVAITTAVFLALALYMAITGIPIFRAEVVITPAREQGMGGLSSLLGQVGGLANIAGMNLGDNDQQREQRATLESRRLVQAFVQRDDVWPLLLRSEEISGKAQAQKAQPSLWVVVQKFRKNELTITEDKIKGTTTIAMDWTDPAVAARWANEFVAMANDLLRQRAISDSTRNIAYLNEQISHTGILEMQHVMYDLIEQQTKTLMLANGRSDYAFTIVDPAVAPEVRISPKRTLLTLGGLLVGLLIGGAIALVYDKFAPPRRVRVMTSSA